MKKLFALNLIPILLAPSLVFAQVDPASCAQYNPPLVYDASSQKCVQGSGNQVSPALPTATQPTSGSTPSQTVNATGNGTNLGYVPLEPIAGVTTDANGGALTLPTLLKNVFNVLITIGALLAVLMLVIGGIEYMLSEAMSTKMRGRERAKRALQGILLVAGAWLILNTINPQLLNFNLSACPDGSVCNATNDGSSAPSGPIASGSVVTLTASQKNTIGLSLANDQALVLDNNDPNSTSKIYNFQTKSCGGNNAAVQQSGTLLYTGDTNQTVYACATPNYAQAQELNIQALSQAQI